MKRLYTSVSLKQEWKRVNRNFQLAVRHCNSCNMQNENCRWFSENAFSFEEALRIVLSEAKSAAKVPAIKQGHNKAARIIQVIKRGLECGYDITTTAGVDAILSRVRKPFPLTEEELTALYTWYLLAVTDCASKEALNNSFHGENLIVRDCLRAVKAAPGIRFSRIYEHLSKVDEILRHDPAGLYERCDKRTRADYRAQVMHLAAKKHCLPHEAAELALHAAIDKSHRTPYPIGFILRKTNNRVRTVLYFLSFFILAFAFSIGGVCLLPSLQIPLFFLITFLMLPSCFVLSKYLLDRLSMRLLRVFSIPALSMEHVPKKGSTALVYTTVLSRNTDTDLLIQRLEDCYLRNREQHVQFGILADFKEAPVPIIPTDHAILQYARSCIDRLNRLYGERFFLFVRTRQYNDRESVYMGWERKRGALIEFASYLRSGSKQRGSFLCCYGCEEALRKARFLFTLDSDCELPHGAVVKMISAMLHPQNRPRLNRLKNAVCRGYAILQPAFETTVQSAGATAFSSITTGNGGCSHYSGASSDTAMNVFGNSVFCGKGLIDIAAFTTVMQHAFPDNAVLSHDNLEGARLRCAYFPYVTVLDQTPATAQSNAKREERWIRGDVQALRFIGRSVRTRSLEKVKNPISFPSAFLLLWNVIRASERFTSLAVFLLASLMCPEAPHVALLAFLPTAFPYLYNVLHSVRSLRYREPVMSPWVRSVISFLYHEITRAASACLSLIGVSKALFRMFVSKRHLLQWVTASEGERNAAKRTLFFSYKTVVSAFVGLLLLFLHTPTSVFYGFLFLAEPFISQFLSHKQRPNCNHPDVATVSFCREEAADIWRFFSHYVGERTMWLPPDHVQSVPKTNVAMQTSPTNIGMYLQSVLAARDFGFISQDEMVARISKAMGTVKKLEHWHGNLYNWYYLESLSVLGARFVSSVDMGNYLASLYTVAGGLDEYKNRDERIVTLIEELLHEAESAEIELLYDHERELFAVGYLTDENKLTEQVYDLYMSEARTMSYIAISTGKAPSEHWSALSRVTVRINGYLGMRSWSGTAFETFMPYIWLNPPGGTLEAEALCFAEWAQRQERLLCQSKIGNTALFGISESAYFAFDRDMNYQYRAFGVPLLGLEAGLAKNRVAAPYASFLMLPRSLDRHSIIGNLRAFANMSAKDRYGYFDAVDMTPARVGSGCAIIRTQMSHHAGMSISALANTAFDGIMQKRLMQNPSMRSGSLLLASSLPVQIKPLKTPYCREIPQTVHKPDGACTLVNENSKANCGYLCDSVRRLLVLPDGSLFLSSGERVIINKQATILFKIDGRTVPLLVSDSESTVHIRNEENCLVVTHVERGITVGCRFFFSADGGALCFDCYTGVDNHIPVSVSVAFQPVLSRRREYESHPMFCRLFFETVYDKSSHTLLYSRCAREEADTSYYMAFACCDDPTGVSTILPRVTPRRNVTMIAAEAAFSDSSVQDGACPRPLCCMSQKTKNGHARFALACSTEAQDAVERVLFALKTEGRLEPDVLYDEYSKADEKGRTSFEAALIRIYSRETEFAKETLLPVVESRALWANGISGDDPILYVETDDVSEEETEETERLRRALRVYRRLKLSGEGCDLVISFHDTNPYHSAHRQAVFDEISSQGLFLLFDQPHGIHLVDRIKAKDLCKILPYIAVYTFQSDPAPWISAPHLEPIQQKAQTVAMMPDDEHEVYGGAFDPHARTFTVIKGTQTRPWSYLLTHSGIGTLLTQNSLGFTFVGNAQQDRISPWNNDEERDFDGEVLMFSLRNGSCYDLCACSTEVMYGDEKVVYIGNIKGVQYSVTVSLVEKMRGKRVFVVLDGALDGCHLFYRLTPVLGERRTENRALSFSKSNNSCFIRRHYGSFRERTVILSSFGDGMVKNFSLRGICYCGRLLQGTRACSSFLLGAFRTEPELSHLLQIKDKTVKPKEEALLSCDLPRYGIFSSVFLERQVIRSRLEGRTGFQQSGGAYGFRDQLQDTLCLLSEHPEYTRRQLLRAASVQFLDGDVLHWWHLEKREGVELPCGVRTRCSDDALWMVYCLQEYVLVTGDILFLKTPVRYISAEALQKGETERYALYARSDERESLYMHCIRALEHALVFGEHGLPLFGSGDWNDGMNRVGIDGLGESVWLGMFLSLILHRMLPLSELLEDRIGFLKYEKAEQTLNEALRASAYDGSWFLRGFYDSGQPLGAHGNDACEIDLMPQAFAAILNALNNEKPVFPKKWVECAMRESLEHLWDKEHHVLKLLTPPFDRTVQKPGYISAYAPGVRENGGQYTHAAVFFIRGLFAAGDAYTATKLLIDLCPAVFCRQKDDAIRYGAEPYVMAGDVWTVKGMEGEAGWTWYTGSASWYRKTVFEYLLGICPRGRILTVRPQFSELFTAFTVKMVLNGTPYTITARLTGQASCSLDGIETSEREFPLDGKTHELILTV